LLDYLGIELLDYDKGGKFEVKQSFLIDGIIDSLGFEQRMTMSQASY